MNYPTVDPLPALRICYTTPFGTIADPKLHTTLNQCLDIIAVRQRDFSTALTVTVTDITTDETIYKTHYERPVPPLALPWLLSWCVLSTLFASDSFHAWLDYL